MLRRDVSVVFGGKVDFFLKKFRVLWVQKKIWRTPFDRRFTLLRSPEERERKKKTTRKKIYTHVRIIVMGRTPVKLKEVIYGISSNKVEIMGSLGRDALSAISKKIGGGWFDVTVFGIAPTVGTVMWVILFSLIYLLFSGRLLLLFPKRMAF